MESLKCPSLLKGNQPSFEHACISARPSHVRFSPGTPCTEVSRLLDRAKRIKTPDHLKLVKDLIREGIHGAEKDLCY